MMEPFEPEPDVEAAQPNVQIVNPCYRKLYMYYCIVQLPIFITDLILSYSSNSNPCFQIKLKNQSITMQTYLCVSAYVLILIIFYYMVRILCCSRNEDERRLLHIGEMLQFFGNYFILIWNIFGLLLLLQVSYPHMACSSNMIVYIYISVFSKIFISLEFIIYHTCISRQIVHLDR
jgi:hypothetical protein